MPECNTAFYCDDVFLSALRGCVWSVVLQALLLPWKGLSEGSWKEAQAMWLQIYSALSLDSPTGNWDICFFPGSSIGYVVFCFFFFLCCLFQKAISQEESFWFNLQIICLFVCFFPGIKQLNNQLTLIQAELRAMYGHLCRDSDQKSAA